MWDSQQITQLTKGHDANTGLSDPDTLNTAYKSHHRHYPPSLTGLIAIRSLDLSLNAIPMGKFS